MEKPSEKHLKKIEDFFRNPPHSKTAEGVISELIFADYRGSKILNTVEN